MTELLFAASVNHRVSVGDVTRLFYFVIFINFLLSYGNKCGYLMLPVVIWYLTKCLISQYVSIFQKNTVASLANLARLSIFFYLISCL